MDRPLAGIPAMQCCLQFQRVCVRLFVSGIGLFEAD